MSFLIIQQMFFLPPGVTYTTMRLLEDCLLFRMVCNIGDPSNDSSTCKSNIGLQSIEHRMCSNNEQEPSIC
jgi:hypothetical protein